MTLREIQEQQVAWAEHNFPKRDSYQPLLCAVEELGELAHAHLKQVQGIRGTAEEHICHAKDAIGDVIMALIGYCDARGFDIQSIVEDTWNEIRQRDFRKYPKNGRTE